MVSRYADEASLTGIAVVVGYGVFFMDWDKEKQGESGEVPFDGVGTSKVSTCPIAKIYQVRTWYKDLADSLWTHSTRTSEPHTTQSPVNPSTSA